MLARVRPLVAANEIGGLLRDRVRPGDAPAILFQVAALDEVAAPLATVDIAVDLPASTATKQPRPDKPVFITLKADRTLAVGETPISRAALASSLASGTSSDHNKRLFVRADKTVPYGDVMTLMNDIRGAGYLKVGLVALEAVRPPEFGAPAPASPAPTGSQ